MTTLSFVLIVLYGSVWGSFLTVAGLRIPLRQPFVFSRSACPHCKTALAPIELIPVLSILFQKGRCRHCKQPIALLYPLTELAAGLLGAFSIWYVHMDWNSMATLFLLISFGILFSVTDLTYRILPNKLMLCFLAAVFFVHIVFRPAAFIPHLLTGIGFFAFFYLFYLLFPDSIGGGDVKCYGVLGILLGYQTTLAALLFASGSACLVYFFLRFFKDFRKDTPIPFAPFIFIGAYVSYLFSPQLLFYLNAFLFSL